MVSGLGRRAVLSCTGWISREFTAIAATFSDALHRALEDAVKDGLLTRNPADGACTKPKTHTETRAWNAEELGRFIRATADDRLAALRRVAAMTGMRRGEILCLRWIDVDIDRGALAVVQARVRGDGAVETTTPKTERGRRSA